MAKGSINWRVVSLEDRIVQLEARMKRIEEAHPIVEGEKPAPVPPVESTPEPRAPVTLVEGAPEPQPAAPSVESKPPEERPIADDARDYAKEQWPQEPERRPVQEPERRQRQVARREDGEWHFLRRDGRWDPRGFYTPEEAQEAAERDDPEPPAGEATEEGA